jgi:hypothetical protein
MTPRHPNHNRRGHRPGRGVAELLADFGQSLPARPAGPALARDGKVFTRLTPRRGRRGPDAGWAPVPAPLATWRMTSDQTPVFWPLIAASGLPPTGALMGIDLLSAGAFYCDPIGWVTND